MVAKLAKIIRKPDTHTNYFKGVIHKIKLQKVIDDLQQLDLIGRNASFKQKYGRYHLHKKCEGAHIKNSVYLKSI